MNLDSGVPRFRAFCSLAALAALAAGCTIPLGSAGSRAAMTVREATHALVEGAPAGGGSLLVAGDRIRTGPSGHLIAVAAGGPLFEVAPDTDALIASEGLELIRGSALVLSDGEPAVVRVSGLTVLVRSGVVRVDRRLFGRVGVYRGSADVSRTGRSVAVGAFREIVIGAGELPRELLPLSVWRADAWDERYLGHALAWEPWLRSEREVGSVIANAATAASGRPAADVRSEIAALRDRGASWSLISLALGLDPDDVVRAIRAAREAAPEEPPRASPPPAPRRDPDAASAPRRPIEHSTSREAGDESQAPPVTRPAAPPPPPGDRDAAEPAGSDDCGLVGDLIGLLLGGCGGGGLL